MTETKIGIFWYYKQKVLSYSETINVDESFTDVFDLDVAHYEIWALMVKDNQLIQDYAYDELPRGRVVYDSQKNRFLVYADSVLIQNTTFQKKLIAAFMLNNATVTFIAHDAYTFNSPLNNHW